MNKLLQDSHVFFTAHGYVLRVGNTQAFFLRSACTQRGQVNVCEKKAGGRGFRVNPSLARVAGLL